MGMTTSCCAAKKWMMKRNGAACNRFVVVTPLHWKSVCMP